MSWRDVFYSLVCVSASGLPSSLFLSRDSCLVAFGVVTSVTMSHPKRPSKSPTLTVLTGI